MKIAIAGGTGTVGSYVGDEAEDAGHDVVVLSRKSGVDVKSGEGLAAALDNVDVVVDTLNLLTLKGSVVREFFVTTSRNLQEEAARQGVQHIITLSIVGIDRVPGYRHYDAKLAQERAVTEGPVPVTILRATQFHEFPAQLIGWTRRGPFAFVPHMRSQPVAARTVARHLVRLAGTQPGGTHELAGPEVHDIAALAKRLAAARGASVRVIGVRMPGAAAKQIRDGALLATDGTTLDGPTFDEWLAGDGADPRLVSGTRRHSNCHLPGHR